MSSEPFIKVRSKAVPVRYKANVNGHPKDIAAEAYPCVWCDPQDAEDFAEFPLVLRKPRLGDKKWRIYGAVREGQYPAPLTNSVTKKRSVEFLNLRIAPVWRSHYRYIYALRLIRRIPEPERYPKIAALAVAGRLLGLTADSKYADITL